MANVISRRTGCWIQYQLKLSGLVQKTVADEANCSIDMVSHFLCGRKDSMRVRTALCKVLGYESFEALAAAGRDHIPPERGAV
jgi:transcriptional regulator with XRE-family HTH domain